VPGFEGRAQDADGAVLAYRPMLSMDEPERERFEPAALPGEIPSLDIALTPGVTATVSVRGRDGTPRAGLDVEVSALVSSAIPTEYKAWEWHPVPAYVVRGRTDADGACTFSTLSPGVAFQLTVLHDGKRVCEGASPMGLRAGEQRAFDFAVGPFARIVGRAVDPQGRGWQGRSCGSSIRTGSSTALQPGDASGRARDERGGRRLRVRRGPEASGWSGPRGRRSRPASSIPRPPPRARSGSRSGPAPRSSRSRCRSGAGCT
jgi:hypothetical protein